MRQIDKQNESNEKEQTRANHGKIVAPDDEERVRDEKGQNDHANPAHDLGKPETVLYGRATVLGRPYSDEHKRHNDVEETEREVDALYCDISVTLFAVAFDVDIVQSEVSQLLHGPVGEHDP